MKTVHKQSFIAGSIMLVLLSFAQYSPMYSSQNPLEETAAEEIADGAGLIGSLASFGYWTPIILNKIHSTGVLATLNSGHLPRLAIDAACVTSSACGNKSSFALNIACLLGSTASLAVWGPMILANINNPLILARGFIDGLQIILALRKLRAQHRAETTLKTRKG